MYNNYELVMTLVSVSFIFYCVILEKEKTGKRKKGGGFQTISSAHKVSSASPYHAVLTASHMYVQYSVFSYRPENWSL